MAKVSNPPVRAIMPAASANSTPNELQNANAKEKKKRENHRWTEREERLLVEWLQNPDNYQQWKCAGKKDTAAGSGGQQTTKVQPNGKTKTDVAKMLAKYLVAKCGVSAKIRTAKNINEKISGFESKWREANTWLKGTGNGLMHPDESRESRLQRTNIRDEVKDQLKYFFDLDAVFGERPSNEPAYVSNTGSNNNENVMSVMRFNASGDDDDEPDTPEAPTTSNNSRRENNTETEDHRSYQDMVLEGDIDREIEPASADPGKIVIGDKKKKKRQKTVDFPEALMVIEEKKDKRFEEEVALARMRENRMERLQERQIEFQEKQLEHQKSELEVRKMEAENRRMELELLMRKNN
ncbi:uncharacterized protein LOC129592140 [Paramacrobiotus metropolitanus]|uniref:uncharacterized protein LOC129592140 n=1 Tax=Paramacrobiotus metropolitanus TaxID=2943436 RepID=UPI002446461D|nr:uncharacterized protein LOC129592140 [Paramacrobiotus metropolitanus]